MQIDMKMKRKDKKVILRYVFLTVFTLGVILCTVACSGSRTGKAVTFSEVSASEFLEKSDPAEESVEKETLEQAEQTELSETTGNREAVTKIYVHVCGAVVNPGVYELDSDSRVYEGIDAAGGLTKDADEAAVNQAGRVEDGQQIYVYTKKETKDNRENSESESGIPSEQADSASSKVNLNTAGKEELMTLTGIGQAKAQAIIDYRESNGAYNSVEDIMKIDGIKEGVFQKIKDDITI